MSVTPLSPAAIKMRPRINVKGREAHQSAVLLLVMGVIITLGQSKENIGCIFIVQKIVTCATYATSRDLAKGSNKSKYIYYVDKHDNVQLFISKITSYLYKNLFQCFLFKMMYNILQKSLSKILRSYLLNTQQIRDCLLRPPRARGSIPGEAKEFFFSPKPPYQLWTG
jgi:hypothetical protein